MKALSIWQPWASLLAYGVKKYETRSWATNYRGPIAIHAAKKWPSDVFGMLIQADNTDTLFALYKAIETAGYDPHDDASMPLGAIVATAELVDCRPITRQLIAEQTGTELLLGDWREGRFAWEFRNMRMLPEPVPTKGHQGLWNWEAEL